MTEELAYDHAFACLLDMITFRLDDPAPLLNYSIYGITLLRIGNGQGGAPEEAQPRSFIGPVRGKESAIKWLCPTFYHQRGENCENPVLFTLVCPDTPGRLYLRLLCWYEAGEP
jgi:hypothetical protein